MKLLTQLLELSDKDTQRVYNTMISYADENGKNKKIKVSSALSYEKNHPAYIQAKKMLGYYNIKPPKDLATKKGKGETPKTGSTKKAGVVTKPKAAVQPKSKVDFKSDAEKRKSAAKPTGPVYKSIVSHERQPEEIRDAIINKGKSGISDKAYSSLLSKQTEYWGKAVKDKKFFEAVSDWRDGGMANGRTIIDKFIQKNPPPPIKMKSPVWRGMGLTKPGYEKFMKMIDGKSEIKLPPSSFSFDVNTAVEFADTDYQIVMNLKSECNELNAIALSDLPGQQSIYSDKEKELITPSNSTYRIESVKTVTFDWSPDNITMVNLIQKCGMTEAEENVADFSKDEFMDSIMGPTQKLS